MRNRFIAELCKFKCKLINTTITHLRLHLWTRIFQVARLVSAYAVTCLIAASEKWKTNLYVNIYVPVNYYIYIYLCLFALINAWRYITLVDVLLSASRLHQ